MKRAKRGLEEPRRQVSKYESDTLLLGLLGEKKSKKSETLLLGLQGEKQNLWSAQREGGELCSQRGKAAACAILSLRPAFFSSCLLQPKILDFKPPIQCSSYIHVK